MNAINPYRLKISQLRALVAIAAHGKFSEAALQLELSQSALSHAIASLEEELGVVLLQRGRHGATVTPIGEQIVADARQVLQLLETICQKANQAKGLQGGVVRVATVRSIATHVLPEVIVRFRDKFPTISVAIAEYDRYAEVEQALREGSSDIGFTSVPTTDEFEVWELFRDEFVALLPPGTPEEDVSLTWEQLTSYPMIMNLRSVQLNKAVRDHLLKFGYALKLDYEVREDSTISGMVKQGLGATIIPLLAAEPIPEGVQVRRLPVPLERSIGVAMLADALHTPAIFAFLDILKSFWQSQPSGK
ncbi:MAG: LysR family transcriptional regulator [Coleofasciculus sp. Co-bin14]|nr:LysR family transcriptional regulator [Coleofasciculus sp. Co-bin14]